MGALTSTAYRFRARPWDIEGSGTVCTLCPSQCNVELTVRDDAKVVRVLARDNEEVDDGWLCDKGRFGYQSFDAPRAHHRAAGARRRLPARGLVGARAVGGGRGAASAPASAPPRCVGGDGHQRGGLPGPAPAARGARLAARRLARRRRRSTPSTRARSRAPTCRREVSDIDHADAILVLDTELVDEAPILDLRVRKAVRRNGARLVVASSRPSTLDGNAAAALRFAPGAAEAALGALAAALGSPAPAASLDDLAGQRARVRGLPPRRAPNGRQRRRRGRRARRCADVAARRGRRGR